MTEIHLIPWGDVPNAFIDVMELQEGHEHIYVLREGQTAEEFWSELDAAEVRTLHGLPPGRTMPTDEEIAAGPAPAPAIISYGDFRARWEPAELAGLFAARNTVWQVDDYVSLAQAQNAVNLSSPTAAAAHALFVELGVLTEKRAEVIFASLR